jgi:hypothetical protein
MKKMILILFVLNSLNAVDGFFTVKGNIKPASIVSFSALTTTDLLTNDTNAFKGTNEAIQLPITLGQLLIFEQNIFVKTNTNVPLGIRLESPTGTYGDLKLIGGNRTDVIGISYSLGTTSNEFDFENATQYLSLGITRPQLGTEAISKKLIMKSVNVVDGHKTAGKYQAIVNVYISASI